MKFSYQWIKDLIPGLENTAKELEQLITVRTAECEGIVEAGALLAGARVARVLSAEPIAGTRITKAIVDVGEAEPIVVACGAPNCRAGMSTVWAPVGMKLIQGVESNGMLASAAELGIGRDQTGIIEWSEGVLDLAPDEIIEIDNKSLTHRPDLWGHLGMAREIAAITKRTLRDAVDLSRLPGGSDSYDVRVEDEVLCPRFSVVVFEDVVVRPAPYWLQYRLLSVGLNPINNIVDITNFVMAELAQPMHAFDRDQLQGDCLLVRRAHEGERIAALNDEEYVLQSSDGVVADRGGAVSVAGIIGGRNSAISEATTNVVFESANWHASTIRKTSSRLKLRTDASMRFEKAQDPVNTVRALARTIELMKALCPEARLVGRLTDVYESLPKPKHIELRVDVLSRKLGRDVSVGEARDILERLAFETAVIGAGVLDVKVPSWRATKDVQEADDLVEEVGRMIGYDTIDAAAPLVASAPAPANPQRLWLRTIRAFFTARGYTEAYGYSFLSDEQAARFQLPTEDSIRVLNPIASDQNLLRSSLIPGMFASVELNRKHFTEFRIFEVGYEIHNQAPASPLEIAHLTAACYAAAGDGTEGLFELKGLVESLAPDATVVATGETLSFEHPARAANIILRDVVIGRLFEAHPKMMEGRAAMLDLNLDRLFEARRERVGYVPLQRYPSSAFDLSIIAGDREPAGGLEAKVRSSAGPLLERVEYVREYHGAQVPDGMKSITFRLTCVSPDRTLSSEEIGAIRMQVIEKIRALGYDMKV